MHSRHVSAGEKEAREFFLSGRRQARSAVEHKQGFLSSAKADLILKKRFTQHYVLGINTSSATRTQKSASSCVSAREKSS